MEETMIHPETGEILHRDVREVEYSYKGEKFIVNQPGWFPAVGTDGVLSQEDMKVSGAALRKIKARHAEKISKNNFPAENFAIA